MLTNPLENPHNDVERNSIIIMITTNKKETVKSINLQVKCYGNKTDSIFERMRRARNVLNE